MNIVYDPQDAGRDMHLAANRAGPIPISEIGGREDVPILAQYWHILYRRRWIVLGAIAIALVIGAVMTILAEREYVATTRLEISREVQTTGGVAGEAPQPMLNDREFYETQYGLLRSRSLARRVADQLDLPDDERFRRAFGLDDEGGPFAEEASGPLTRAERQEMLDTAEDILLNNISVQPTLNSRLVDLSFSSPDPVLSARIANAWSTNFIESSLERRFESASYARNFLEDRLGQVRERLEAGERALVTYATQQGLVNINSDAAGSDQSQLQSVAANNLEMLNEQLAAATADRIRAESRLRQAADGSTSESLNNSAIAAMRERRAEAAAELAQILVQFEPEYPKAQELRTQVNALDQSIAREERRVGDSLGDEYRAASERERALGTRVQSLKQEVLDLRRRGIQYNILQRDVDTSRELYQGLLQQYKEIGIAGGIGRNNIAVVDKAVAPEEPSSPRPLLNMVLALLLGTAAGVGLAFILNQLDEAITDPADLAVRLGIPALGTIPRSHAEDILEALRDPTSDLSEGYMALRTNLEFSTPSGIPRNLVITSSRAAEGKSTTALGTASALARLGSRVLLVDADMRSPSIHQVLGLSNGKGLSSYLIGSSELHQIAQPTSFENLSAVPSGPVPPSAAELLAGSGITRFLAAAQDKYDYVVIDAPPVLGLADAPLLGSKSDAVIFVVEAGSTKTRIMERALIRLRATHAVVIGAVLTKFEPRFAAYDYGDAYDYSYGKHPVSAV